MTEEPLTWVVGAGGLLGSSVAQRIPRGTRWQPVDPVRWGTPDAADQVEATARAFLRASSGRPWQVAWCAGAGVTSTTADALAEESGVFDRALTALAQADEPNRGALFVTSSAGGVYAGSDAAPHDEHTAPVAISPYGRAKLGLEQRAARLHDEAGVPVLIGRLSNLYGPGQNLGKAQGLISQIVRSQLLGRSISIYVPLDTVRDNIYVTDAARLVTTGLERLRVESQSAPRFATKVLASQQGVTIGFLIAELGRVLKRRPRVVYGASASSAFQVRDLRMRSLVWPELDREPLVPLPVGMLRTVESLTRALGAGTLR